MCVCVVCVSPSPPLEPPMLPLVELVILQVRLSLTLSIVQLEASSSFEPCPPIPFHSAQSALTATCCYLFPFRFSLSTTIVNTNWKKLLYAMRVQRGRELRNTTNCVCDFWETKLLLQAWCGIWCAMGWRFSWHCSLMYRESGREVNKRTTERKNTHTHTKIQQ